VRWGATRAMTARVASYAKPAVQGGAVLGFWLS
jgi:hypothetical protein